MGTDDTRREGGHLGWHRWVGIRKSHDCFYSLRPSLTALKLVGGNNHFDPRISYMLYNTVVNFSDYKHALDTLRNLHEAMPTRSKFLETSVEALSTFLEQQREEVRGSKYLGHMAGFSGKRINPGRSLRKAKNGARREFLVSLQSQHYRPTTPNGPAIQQSSYFFTLAIFH